MKGTAQLFLLTAIAFVVAGMAWGIQMAASGDHRLSPAHAHLNLIGFAVGSVFAIHLALTPRADGRLARVLYALWVSGTILMAIGIRQALTRGDEALVTAGSILTVLSMLLFGWIVLRRGIGRAGGI